MLLPQLFGTRGNYFKMCVSLLYDWGFVLFFTVYLHYLYCLIRSGQLWLQLWKMFLTVFLFCRRTHRWSECHWRIISLRLPCCVRRKTNENWWHNYKHECVCALVSKRTTFLSSLHSSPPLSFFTSDACLPITLSTGSNKHYSYKSTNIIASTLEKLLLLYLCCYDSACIFHGSFVIDHTFFFLLVSEITKFWGDSASLSIISFTIKQVILTWVMDKKVGKSKVDHDVIRKPSHKSSTMPTEE